MRRQQSYALTTLATAGSRKGTGPLEAGGAFSFGQYNAYNDCWVRLLGLGTCQAVSGSTWWKCL